MDDRADITPSLPVDLPARTMPDTAPEPKRLVGRRLIVRKFRTAGDRPWHRWRYPFTRRTPLLLGGDFNPRTLAAERTIIDKRPLYWLAFFAVVVAAGPLLGESVLGAATIFAIYASINVIWLLVIGTAGIFSLATLAVVGTAAYGAAYLSIHAGLAWWGMLAIGPLFGLLFGVVIAIPAMRIDGFYYALLTLGLTELCRVYVVQSQALGSATNGLYGADGLLPDTASLHSQIIVGYYAALVLMVASLALFRLVNGQRLGRLLRAAPERREAFAQALGVDYRAARIKVFLISSAALGLIGGFYAVNFRGVSPSLFSMDSLLLLLAMVVIGGIGRPEGAVLGTAIVVAIDRLLIGLGPLRLILVALIMVGTVLFLHNGLVGTRDQFRAWRNRRRSESRAKRDIRGGEYVPEEASEIRDKQIIAFRRFNREVRERLKASINDAMIEAHRRRPNGPHDDALSRVLNYFRRAAVTDKYAILAVKPFAEYRMVALSGQRGVPPRMIDDRVFPTEDEAMHAVFLKRVQDLMES
jgi:branched-chain amino acid transport system permease protein